MKFFKKMGKAVKKLFKQTADNVSEVGDKIVDAGETVGDITKDAFDHISTAIKKIDINLPVPPKMPEIKGAKGKDFIEEKREWIDNYLAENDELIKQASKLAEKLAKHKDEIREARKNKRPLTDALMNDIGAITLFNDSADNGLKSVSFGIGGDGSMPTQFGSYGGNGTAGINNSIDDGLRVKTFLSIAVSGGVPTIPSVDGSVAIGFWNDKHDEIGGWSHGIVFGGSYKYGVALAFFWKIGGDSGGDFAGWSISPQVGFSAELEYNIGYTFN